MDEDAALLPGAVGVVPGYQGSPRPGQIGVPDAAVNRRQTREPHPAEGRSPVGGRPDTGTPEVGEHHSGSRPSSPSAPQTSLGIKDYCRARRPSEASSHRRSIDEVRPRDLNQGGGKAGKDGRHIRWSNDMQPISASDEEGVKDRDRRGCVAIVGECLGGSRRKLVPRCRALLRTKVFQGVMFAALLAALFLPDIWVLANRPNNNDADVVLTCVLFLFLVELVVQSIGLSRTYLGRFFFWMDLLGAISLLLDLSYISSQIAFLNNGNNGAAGNVAIMRAARVAKLGARAGRFTRLVKLLRYLPGMRDRGKDAGTAKVISAMLVTALSTRVSCLIIVMVVLMPLFSMWTFPEQDWSMSMWMLHFERLLERHPDRLTFELEQFSNFYGGKGYFPFKVSAKNANMNETALASLPWQDTDRGGPLRKTNVMVRESDHLLVEYNFQYPSQVESLLNLLLLVTVMVLMVGFSLVLSKSVSSIVLKPLDTLLCQVRRMASTIFQSVTDMTTTMKDKEEPESDDGANDEEDGSKGNAFGNETELLEKVVSKLAILTELTNSKVQENTRTETQTEAERDAAWGEMIASQEQSSDYESMMGQQRAMLVQAGLSLELLQSWNMNPLELDKAMNHCAVMFFVGPQNHGITYEMQLMDAFLEAVEAGYNKSVPYHNWFHAVDVSHAVYRWMQMCACEKYLSSTERYALLISAVCHDIAHPGLNNSFLVATSHELALRYNDKSPLENMHCATLFEMTNSPKMNIMVSLSKQQYQEVRKTCIDCILNTDGALHFTMLKDLQMLYEVNSEVLDAGKDVFAEDMADFPTRDVVDSLRQPENRKLLTRLLLHLADMSNSCKPFRICSIWAAQVLEEFFVQGDQEKRLNIPVQALNDRDKVNLPFSQIGFIEFLVSPMLLAVIKVLPPLDPLAERMVSNVQEWFKEWVKETNPTEASKKALEDRILKIEHKFHECRS